MNGTTIEDTTPSEMGATPIDVEESKDALSAVSRLISSDDLAHSGVQKLVLDRLDKAERVASRYENLREEAHRTSTELAVTRELLSAAVKADRLESILLGVGTLFLGYVPNAGDLPLQGVLLIAGIAMVVGSIYSKRGKQEK